MLLIKLYLKATCSRIRLFKYGSSMRLGQKEKMLDQDTIGLTFF